jgi:hypothetical protein
LSVINSFISTDTSNYSKNFSLSGAYTLYVQIKIYYGWIFQNFCLWLTPQLLEQKVLRRIYHICLILSLMVKYECGVEACQHRLFEERRE